MSPAHHHVAILIVHPAGVADLQERLGDVERRGDGRCDRAGDVLERIVVILRLINALRWTYTLTCTAVKAMSIISVVRYVA